MSIFSKSKQKTAKEERVLIFDIGSGSIGAALLVRQKGATGILANPKILYTVRKNIPVKGELEFVPFVQNMLTTVEEVCKELSRMQIPIPSRIECILAAPWYASQTRVIKHSKHTPFIFTKKLWYELVQKEIALFEETHSGIFSEFESKPRIIEKKNMHISLNGYVEADPIGKRARELDLSLYLSMTPEYVATSLEEIIESYFRQPISFSTFIFSSYMVARDLFISEHNYLLVDIGGEMTDIGLVKKDVLFESATFPRGRNFLIRRMMHHLNMSYQETMSLLSLYKDGALTQKIKNTVSAVVERVKVDWLTSFQGVLGDIITDFSSPETIFVTADDDVAPFFTDAIHGEQFTQFTLASRRFNVIIIEASSLHEFCTLEKTLYRDPFLMLEAIFVSRR